MSAAGLPKPRALLFDWDNTLIDSWSVIHAAMNATLAAMGRAAWSRAETEGRVRASLRDSFPDLFGEDWRKAERVFYDAFAALHIAELRACPGAGALLAWAAERFYLGVVSNKRGAFLRKEAAHLGWSPHFRVLAGAGDARRDKPAREAVELALGAGGIAPGADVWLIGDTDIDMECALRSGCLPVLVRAAPPSAGEFAAAPPALYFSDLAGLHAHLRTSGD